MIRGMSLSDDNYNPFQRLKRGRDFYFVEEDDAKPYEDPKDASEPVISQFLRRATRRSTFNPIFSRRTLPRVEPIVSHGSRLDEESASTPEPDPLEITEGHIGSFHQRLYHIWRRVKTKLGFRGQWDVKPALAQIAQLTLANAPLGTKGKVLLEAFARPNRRSKALVAEYNICVSSINGKSMS